jgi:hypothetical protein
MLWQTSSSFLIIFSSVAPHRGQPAAKCHPRWHNPLEDWQSAVGWGDSGFEPRTVGQQLGTLPLSDHASLIHLQSKYIPSSQPLVFMPMHRSCTLDIINIICSGVYLGIKYTFKWNLNLRFSTSTFSLFEPPCVKL